MSTLRRFSCAVFISSLIALWAFEGARASTQAAGRTLAVVFEDLPFVDVSVDVDNAFTNAQIGTTELVRLLIGHRVPVVGFVNENELTERVGRDDLLLTWTAAGGVLGNGTWSHPDLNSVSAETFQTDIKLGETSPARLKGTGASPAKFFRYPRNHTGDTAAKKAAVEAFLTAAGYHIVPHTIETEDVVFNAVMMRARDVDDPALVRRTLTAYVDFVMTATDHAERSAQQVFGRDIPQVVVLHPNDLNTDALDELLMRFENRGYTFVPLGTAMSDPAYQTKDTFVTADGPTWLVRWARSLAKTVSSTAPKPPQWVLDYYNRQ
jgi:peptidoglycan/xylan/chitin deacetylase (PgdA/CDA1 family)